MFKVKFFSLIELVVVIGIISILMMVAFPLATSSEDNSMETVCRRITNLFESARTLAQMRGTTVTATVDFQSRTFSAESGGGGSEGAISLPETEPREHDPNDLRYKNRAQDANAENLRRESAEGRRFALQNRLSMLGQISEVRLPEFYTVELIPEEDRHPYLADFIPKETGSVKVQFRPDGTATLPKIRIRTEDEARTISVQPLTGRVQIEEVQAW